MKVFRQTDVSGNFTAELQIMEQYYFIQQNGVKKGPFKLNELKSENIYFDELVWRSDDDKWKNANEFEELKDIIIIKPPQTQLEKNKSDFNNYFIRNVIPNSIIIYIIVALLLSFISYFIAEKSWENEKNKFIINSDQVGKNDLSPEEKMKIVDLQYILSNTKTMIKEYNNLNLYVKPIINKKKFNFDKCTKSIQDSVRKYNELKFDIEQNHEEIDLIRHDYVNNGYVGESKLSDTAYLDSTINARLDSRANQTIQPIIKIPDNILLNEELNSSNQIFILRPFYVFSSKLYLTREEQNSSGTLFKNIALSTFLFLTILLIMTLVIYYFTKISNINN